MTEATMRLYHFYAKDLTAGRDYLAYGLTAPPTSSTNWSNQPTATDVSAVAFINHVYGWYSWNIASLANRWVQSASLNTGVTLQHLIETDALSLRKFYASEYGSWTPNISITFTVPPNNVLPTEETVNFIAIGGDLANYKAGDAVPYPVVDEYIDVAPGPMAGLDGSTESGLQSSASDVVTPTLSGGIKLLSIGRPGREPAYQRQWSDTATYGYCRSGGECTVVGQLSLEFYLDMNGKASRWSMWSQKMTGPSLRYVHGYNCIDDNGFMFNTSCSGGPVTRDSFNYEWTRWPFSIQHPNFNYPNTTIHEDPATYWYNFVFQWQAEGFAGHWTAPKLSTDKFNCKERPNGKNCQF